MANASFGPLPDLPLEVIGHILSLCEAPTLAVSSRVCLALLELVGPLLYRDIVIRGEKQLDKLIRSKDVLASISPFVSLTQTRTLAHAPLNGSFRRCDISRPLSSSVVRLEKVTIDLRYTPADGDASSRLDVLLTSLDPTQLHVLGSPDPDGSRVKRYLNMPRSIAWSHLQALAFTNALDSGPRLTSTGLADRVPLLDLEYNLSRADSDARYDSLHANLAWIQDSLRSPAGQASPAFGAVRVKVDDKSEVVLARQLLVGCSCQSMDIRADDVSMAGDDLPD